MKKVLKAGAFAALFILVLSLGLLAGEGFRPGASPAYIYGRNTFAQEFVQEDGSVVNYFASGDEYFHYLHDKDGYILVQNNGYVYYAAESGGKPVPTSVRYDGDKEKIGALKKMSYADIDFNGNPDLVISYPESAAGALYESAAAARPIVNIVILISFKGENVTLDEAAVYSALDGNGNSLRDYYQKLSYGEIFINNVSPVSNNKLFLYQDSQPRSYYSGLKDGSRRTTRERDLLNAAVNASKQYLDLEGLNVDINYDGYVDAVNFLVTGSPDGWSELLWPHSWDLDDISAGNPATISGYKVKKYSFNFLGQLTVGLLAHEFAHVLGTPDLYHYNDSHYAIGDWDLMHLEGNTPQYMNTYFRNKYLNCIGQEQIAVAEYNGTYSLKPVTTAGRGDVLAYRINSPLRSDEYFMVEYRNNNVSSYDSSLPGSGLIVYRICTRATGNVDARKNNASYPDEVYIFRPNIITSGGESAMSRANLMKAYLSPENQQFTTLGRSTQQSSVSYASTNIYFTNGANSGIIITALDISDEGIVFDIKLSGTQNVDDGYFAGKLSLDAAAIGNNEFSGVYAEMNAGTIDTANLASIILSLKNASGEITATMRLNRSAFLSAYNTAGLRKFPVRFIVNGKGNESSFSTVFYACDWLKDDKPVSMSLYAVDADNDLIQIASAPVSGTDWQWEAVQKTNIKYKPQIAASLIATAVVREDGKACVSSNRAALDGLTLTDVITVSAGSTHILYTKSDMKARAVGIDGSGDELNVASWSNIIKTAAGNRVSFGMDLYGRVYYAGGTSVFDAVTSWQNVVDIAAGENHVAAVLADGTVRAAGNNAYGKLNVSEWRNVVAITCGENYTAGLTSSGQVLFTGDMNGSAAVLLWTGVKKIAGGKNHLLALTVNGNVLSAGRNDENQLNVTAAHGFGDIIDIAAGFYQSVLLRTDGVLIYAGANTNGTNTVTENLIYYRNDYVEPSGITLPFTEKVLTTGSVLKLEVGIYPQNTSYKSLKFSSSNPNAVSVSANGTLTVHAAGVAVITVTHASKSELTGKITVTATEPIQTKAMLAAGENHSVVLYSDGTVEAAGDNTYGQCNVTAWGSIVFIAAYGDTTAGITANGTVKMAGKLAGLNTASWKDIVYISVGENAIAAVNSSGQGFAAGSDNDSKITAFISDGGVQKVSVSVSSTHIVALDVNGTAHAYGGNSNGQVGALSGNRWTNIVKVLAGEGFSIGLKADGTLYYAGQSAYFDITNLSEWYDIVDIDISASTVAGVTYNGKVLASGDNGYRQCDTSGYSDIALIAAGGKHTLIAGFDGIVGGKGKNSDGRLNFLSVGSIDKIPLTSIDFVKNVYDSSSGQYKSAFGVAKGGRIKLAFNAEPYNATLRVITYRSSNALIASVNAEGYVTGLLDGEVVITAEADLGGTTVFMTAPVYVYSTVQSVSWINKPSRRAYSVGETLDLIGGSIEVTVAAGKNFVTAVTKDMIQNYATATASAAISRTVTVKVADKLLTYDIHVRNNVKSIEIDASSSLKTQYLYGEAVSLTGGNLKVTRADGSSEILNMNALISSGVLTVSANTLQLQPVKVVLRYCETYTAIITGEYTESFTNYFYSEYEILVRDEISSINASLDHDVLNYGESLYGNGSINIVMRSGAIITEPIIQKTNVEDGQDSVVTVENFNPFLLGKQTVTIRYFDPVYESAASCTVIVEVKDTVLRIEVTSMTITDASFGKAYLYDSTKAAEQSIMANVVFAGGYIAQTGYTAQGLAVNEYVKLTFTAENTQNEGMHVNVLMKLSVKTVSGAMSLQKEETVNLFGLGSVISLTFVDARDNPAVPFEYKYGEKPDIKIRIITAGNPSGHLVDIDHTLLGVDITKLGVQYLNYTVLGKAATTTAILYIDYLIGIDLDRTEAECVVGEMFVLTVYGVMASGAKETASGWTTEFFDVNALGKQNVLIKYAGYSKMLEVTVLNEILTVVVLRSPKTSYELNEEIDLSLFRIRVNYKSGAPDTLDYVGNESKFTVSGYDKSIIGHHNVTIKYLSYSWQFVFEVRNKISRISVDPLLSRKVYTVGETLSIVVICYYENGESERVEPGDYTTTFDSSVIGKSFINITYWGQYTTMFEVEVIDAPESLTIIAPLKTNYSYGELLNLEGAKLYIVTRKGAVKEEKLEAYSDYLEGFNSFPTQKGAQTVTLKYPVADYFMTATFKVYFKEKADSVFIAAAEDAAGVKVDRTNTRIIFDATVTYSALIAKLTSYAQIRIYQDGVYLTAADGDTVIKPSAKVDIVNSAGGLIEKMSVYIKGDCDGDGLFTESDLPRLMQIYLLHITGAEVYLDITGNNKFTLLDVTLWIAKLEADDEDN